MAHQKAPNSIWKNPVHFIACGFGVGSIPVMPGTFGTLLGVLLYWVLHTLPVVTYSFVVAVLILLGVFLCGKTNRDFGTDDHPAAVWDEIATFPIVMIAVAPDPLWIVCGFLLFRLFDIWKPGPIGWVDRHVHGGWGVMLDDVLAACFAWLVLQLIILLF